MSLRCFPQLGQFLTNETAPSLHRAIVHRKGARGLAAAQGLHAQKTTILFLMLTTISTTNDSAGPWWLGSSTAASGASSRRRTQHAASLHDCNAPLQPRARSLPLSCVRCFLPLARHAFITVWSACKAATKHTPHSNLHALQMRGEYGCRYGWGAGGQRLRHGGQLG